jgi:serine/threonine protein kinase
VSKKVGFLVYEYAKGKVLSQILQNLSWERRRKITIGIAKALQFLHSYCLLSILVGEMSPEKVVVDGKDPNHEEPAQCF